MDGDYQTWHLHNKVPGILNVIDLLPRDACLPVVTVNTVRRLDARAEIFLSASPLRFPRVCCQSREELHRVFLCDYRESCAWWARSRSIWSAGQETVACWPRTIQGSIRQSRVFALPTILNGNDFPSPISRLRLYCNSKHFVLRDPWFLSLHVYQTAPPPSFEHLIQLHLITAACRHL